MAIFLILLGVSEKSNRLDGNFLTVFLLIHPIYCNTEPLGSLLGLQSKRNTRFSIRIFSDTCNFIINVYIWDIGIVKHFGGSMIG